MLGRHKGNEVDVATTGGFTYPMPSPIKPSALLVPPSVIAKAQSKKAFKVVAAMLALALLISLGAVGFSVFQSRGVEDDLQIATQEKNKKSAELAQLLPVATLSTELGARKSALATELASDLAYSKIVGEIYSAVPSGVAVLSLDFAVNKPCAGPDPFNAGVALGCVTISAETSTATPEKMAAFVSALNARSDAFAQQQATAPDPIDPATVTPEEIAQLPLLSDAFADSFTTAAGDGLQFQVTVNYSLAALSQKFDLGAANAAPTDPAAAPAAAPPAPAPATTPESQ